MADPQKIVLKTKYRQIVYEELPRVHREHWDSSNQMTTRILVINWDDNQEFKEDMLGFSQNLGGKLSRVIPEVHPDNDELWCDEIQQVDDEGKISQDSTIGGLAKSERIRYACTYRRKSYRVVNDADLSPNTEASRYVIRTPKFAYEMEKIPGTNFRWNGVFSNALVASVPAIPICIETIEYKIPMLPPEMVPDFVSYNNKVHTTGGGNGNFDASILPGGFSQGGYGDQKTLFLGGQLSPPYWTPTDDCVVDLTYIFAIKSASWNQVLGMDALYHDVVRTDDASKTIFQTANLNDLFVFTED